MSQPKPLNDLLARWEETYKKGLLSFWILLLLDQRPSYAFEMKALIEELSQGTISADSNSLYRALGRFEEMGLVAGEVRPSASGPDRRYYCLTANGQNLLAQFARRNLLVFQQPEVAERLRVLLAD